MSPTRPPGRASCSARSTKQLIAIDVTVALQAIDARRRGRSAGGLRAPRAIALAPRGRRCRRAARPTAGCRSPHRSPPQVAIGRPHRKRLRGTRAPSGRTAAPLRWPSLSSTMARRSRSRQAHSAPFEDRRRARPRRRRATGVGPQNQAAHQKSAAAFHRASGAPGAVERGERPLLVAHGGRQSSTARAPDEIDRAGRGVAISTPTMPSSKSGRARVAVIAPTPPRAGPLPREIAKAGANKTVADGQVMIEKRQRPIGGERRQPQRQPRELHRHRIEIDAVETALGDGPPQMDPLRAPLRRRVRSPQLALDARPPRHRRGSGRRRRETRRCPSPDRATRSSQDLVRGPPGDERMRACAAPGTRSSRAACRSCPSLFRSVEVRVSTTAAASALTVRSPVPVRRLRQAARRRDRAYETRSRPRGRWPRRQRHDGVADDTIGDARAIQPSGVWRGENSRPLKA